MADGTLRFDTEIDESGFNRGLDRLGRKASRTADNVADSAKDASDTAGRAAKDAAERTERAAGQAGNNARKAGSNVEQAARKASETVRKSSEEAQRDTEKGTEDVVGALTGMAQKAAGVIAGLGIANLVKDAAGAAISAAGELKQGMNQFAAMTGIDTAELSGYQDVMEEIYKNNYGESFEDIGAAMATITKQIGKMDGKSLQKLSESAFALRDAFGYEIEESVRASKAMMDQFGISGEEAMNLIANGAQNGLDYSGELIDSISEYSVQFSKVGLSADDMFSIFQAGADSGAWNLDKIGDAVKEFSIRAIDGSNTTIDGFERLGMNADEMAQKFANGGDGAREAFKQVIKGLAEMEDPVEQSIAGVDLFGTMWEDLGPEVVGQLANIEDAAYGSQDALEQIKEVSYDDVGSSLETLGKTVMTKFIDPIANTALPAVKDVIDGITEAIDRPKTMLEEFVDEVKASNKVVKASISQAKDTMNDAVAEAAKIESYKETLLELNDITEKTEYDRYRMNAIVSELSESVPQLAEAYDEETASINLSSKAIAALMDNEKEYLMQQAAMKAKAEAMEALMQAELNVAKAESAVNDAETNLKEAMEKRRKASEDMYGDYGDYNAEISEWEHQVKNANKALEESKKLEGEAQEEYALTSKSMEDATEKVNEYTNKLAEMEAEEKKASGEVSEANSNMAISGQEMSAEQAAAAQAVQAAYKEMKGSIQDSIESSIDLFEKFSGGTEISKDEILENLKSQSAGVVEWGKNMKTLAARAGEGMTKELYDYLAEMGPQSANLVKAFTQMSKDELTKAAREFASLDSGLSESVSQQVAEASASWGNATGELSQAAGEAGAESAESFTRSASDDIQSGTGEVSEVASDVGTDAGKSMQESTADAVKENSGTVQKSVDNSMRKSEDTALGYYDNFYTVGKNLMEGTVAGIVAGSPAVEKAVRNAAQKAVDGAKDQVDSHSPSRVMRDEVGKMISAGMAEGIKDGTGDVEQSSRDMADVSLNTAKDELDIHSPSGTFRKEVGKPIADGLVKGIQDGEGKLTSVMQKMADKALKAAKSATGDYSDVGSSIMDSIAEGIRKRQDMDVRKAEDLINKYVEKVSNGKAVRSLESRADYQTELASQDAKKQKEKGISEAEKKKYAEREKEHKKNAARYRKKAEAIQKAADEFGATLISSMNDAIQAEYDRIQKELDDNITQISDRYQELYDDVISKRDDMMHKLSNPVNMYDLETQLDQVKSYQDELGRLKGRIPDTLMDQILGMDMNEAVSFADYLNSMTDAQLEAYKGKWEALQNQSETFSNSFFEGQLADIKAGYEKEIEDAMADAQTKMAGVGQNVIKGMIAGLRSEKEALSKECKKIATMMIKQFQKSLDIHSPSKVMANKVGRYIPPGIAEGIEKTMPTVEMELTAGVEQAIEAMQARIEAMQYVPAASYASAPGVPVVSVTNSQPVQVQAEIHTNVDLDGRTVGRSVTPYVNQYFYDQMRREERGG